MSELIASYLPLLDLILLGTGYAFSQYIVLRAGTFSVATAGFASIGAYSAGILSMQHGLPVPLAVAVGTIAGTASGLLLSVPLARLRGVYQAIASLAFVQIIVSLALYADWITGGPLGLNNIPRSVDTWGLLVAVVVVGYFLLAIDRSGVGRVFEAMRQDVAVAASLGVNPTSYHTLAFALSGAIAGLFGALDAFHNYQLTPDQFGFSFLVAVLSYVVLGGRRTIVGPIVGACVLILLPEVSRPLADNRTAIFGILLILCVAYLPLGVADTLIMRFRRRHLSRSTQAVAEARP